MKEIAIIAATIYGNRGAEAMLCTTVGELRARVRNLHCHVYSYYPYDDRQRCTHPNITIHSATPIYVATVFMPLSLLLRFLRVLRLGAMQRFFPTSVRALARSRVLIDLAGVSFMDDRPLVLIYNVLTLWPAIVLGIPVVKLAQGIGPIRSQPNRIAARLTLPHCVQIYARGRETWQHLQEFGGCRVERAADIAFLYHQAYSLSEEEPAAFARLLQQLDKRRATTSQPAIGICPSSVVAARAHSAGQDYVAATAKLIRNLAEQGHQVVLFPNATRARYPNKRRNNDLPLLREIADRLGEPTASQTLVVDMDVNTRAIRELISRLGLVVTSRFHAMVAALSLGVPTFVIGWSHKYLEVMEDFEQAGRALDWQESSVEATLEQIRQLLGDSSMVGSQIVKGLPQAKAAAAAQLDFTAQLVQGAP